MSNVLNLTQNQLDAHASMMRKQVKKKRPCIRANCTTVFVSKNNGHRVCDKCARGEKMGVMAESMYNA